MQPKSDATYDTSGLTRRVPLARRPVASSTLCPSLQWVEQTSLDVTLSARQAAYRDGCNGRNLMTDRQQQRHGNPAEIASGFFVRPLVSYDLGTLMPKLGQLVDALYPSGADKLFARLEKAASSHRGAHVVAHVTRPSMPLALTSEASKGPHVVKLCTFWVAPAWRRRRLGSLLLQDRVESWLASGVNSVHVTVRYDRLQQLRPLLEKLGFRRVAIAAARYYDADEVILQWTPDWYFRQMEVIVDSPGVERQRSA
jgi:ribosomal protein S18 acetylase RimI-like enzyme